MTSVTKQNGDLAGRFDLNAVLGNNKVGVMVNSEGSITGYCTITGNNFTLSFLVDAETGKFTGAVKYLSDNGSTSFLATVPQDWRDTSIEGFQVFANGSSVTFKFSRPEFEAKYSLGLFTVRSGMANFNPNTGSLEAEVAFSARDKALFGADKNRVFASLTSSPDLGSTASLSLTGTVDSQAGILVKSNITIAQPMFESFTLRSEIETVAGIPLRGSPFFSANFKLGVEGTATIATIPFKFSGGVGYTNSPETNQGYWEDHFNVTTAKSWQIGGWEVNWGAQFDRRRDKDGRESKWEAKAVAFISREF
jgi:hypothetical protein